MKIEIDENEYRDLLDIAHIADVVLSGHRNAKHPRSERHQVLIQKLYALAKDAGYERMMRFNENSGKHVPSPEFEKNTLAHVALNEFGEHLFWDHLVSRLAQRDAVMLAGGIEKVTAMDESDRHRLLDAVRQQYAEEFAANDIMNLRLVEPFNAQTTVLPVKTSD